MIQLTDQLHLRKDSTRVLGDSSPIATHASARREKTSAGAAKPPPHSLGYHSSTRAVLAPMAYIERTGAKTKRDAAVLDSNGLPAPVSAEQIGSRGLAAHRRAQPVRYPAHTHPAPSLIQLQLVGPRPANGD